MQNVNLPRLKTRPSHHKQMQIVIYILASNITLWVNHSLGKLLNWFWEFPFLFRIFLIRSDKHQHEMSLVKQFLHVFSIPRTVSQFGIPLKLKKLLKFSWWIKVTEIHQLFFIEIIDQRMVSQNDKWVFLQFLVFVSIELLNFYH